MRHLTIMIRPCKIQVMSSQIWSREVPNFQGTEGHHRQWVIISNISSSLIGAGGDSAGRLTDSQEFVSFPPRSLLAFQARQSVRHDHAGTD